MPSGYQSQLLRQLLIVIDQGPVARKPAFETQSRYKGVSTLCSCWLELSSSVNGRQAKF